MAKPKWKVRPEVVKKVDGGDYEAPLSRDAHKLVESRGRRFRPTERRRERRSR